jgi:mannose-6-phosphate isomerase-like protein (cupin superfamily)
MGRLLHLADVPETRIPAGRWQALNEPLGITHFGVSAVAIDPGEDPDIEHDEASSGHQEVYVVVTGRAAFRMGDEEVEAGRATSSRCPTRRRRAATGRSSRARGSSASARDRGPSTPTAPGSPRRRRPRADARATRGGPGRSPSRPAVPRVSRSARSSGR